MFHDEHENFYTTPKKTPKTDEKSVKPLENVMKLSPKLGAWLEAQFLMAHGWKLSHFRSSWHKSLVRIVGEAPHVEQVLRLPPPIEERACLWGWDLLVLVPDLPRGRLQLREIRVIVVLLAGDERR